MGDARRNEDPAVVVRTIVAGAEVDDMCLSVGGRTFTEVVEDDDRLLVMTVNGKGIRLRVKDIRQVGRIAQGVKLINLAPGDRVRSIARIVQEEDDGEMDAEAVVDGESAE